MTNEEEKLIEASKEIIRCCEPIGKFTSESSAVFSASFIEGKFNTCIKGNGAALIALLCDSMSEMNGLKEIIETALEVYPKYIVEKERYIKKGMVN